MESKLITYYSRHMSFIGGEWTNSEIEQMPVRLYLKNKTKVWREKMISFVGNKSITHIG